MKIEGQRVKMSETFLISGKRTGAKVTAALSNGRNEKGGFILFFRDR